MKKPLIDPLNLVTRFSLCLFLFSFLNYSAFAQVKLSFSGTPTITGTAGTVGAKYTYNNIGTAASITIKGTIEIMAITGGAVLENIDGEALGSVDAFQPVINGSQTAGNCWGIEFLISFFNAADNMPITLSSFKASGVDIDGDNAFLREYNTFWYPSSYTVETTTNVDVTNNSGVYTVRSQQMGYAGIFLTQTNIAVTCLYNNRTTMRVKIGSCCQGGDCLANTGNRLHSLNLFDAVVYTNAFVTLPVQITAFTAIRSSNGNIISWSTDEEQKLSDYEIERSGDGISFSAIGRIAANGSGKYSYTDKSNTPGSRVWYRLKSIDIDGKFYLSKIAFIPGNTIRGVQIFVSANLLRSNLLVTINSDHITMVNLKITDANGKIIQRSQHMVQSGTNAFPLNKEKLSTGVYFLQVYSGNEGEAIKFIVE